MKKKLHTRKFIIAIFFLTLGFVSCRAPREISTVRLNPVAFEDLLEKIESNTFNFSSLTIKRINCQYSNGKSKTGFIASLKAEKNNRILISITKLNIPVGKVLLTPDSVKYVNYISQNYFTDDYSYLSNILNMELNFETVQSFISNNAAQFIEKATENNNSAIQSTIESGMYLIQNTVKNNANPVLHQLFFTPENYLLTRLNIEDNSEKRKINIVFNDFQLINDKQYPGNIEMDFSSPGGKVELSLRNSGFSTDKIESFNFSIPSDYEKLNTFEKIK
jgi:hypothetical protein